MTVRALIVEDEPLARAALRALVAGTDWLAVAGEAADGRTALRMLDDLRPDLVFLDVRLPELGGLDVLRAACHRPAVVFTTAYDRYAVAAFELEALDYLLKPFGRERFGATLARVQRRLQPAPDLVARATSALEGRWLERIFVSHAGRILPVRIEDVALLAGEDDYTRVHAGGRQYLVSVTLSAFERTLDPARFCRVHRSAIVALDHVASIARGERRLVLRLRDGSEVVASRAGSQALRDRMRPPTE